MSRQPLHDPHAVTGDCIRCGMTHEEMLDFDTIECEDARAAQMPQGDERRILRGEMSLTDQQANQRGLMLEGLWWRARMRQRASDTMFAEDNQARAVWWPCEIPIPQFVGEMGARKVTAWPAGFSIVPEPPAPLTSPYPDKYRAALAAGRIAIADLMDGRFTVDELAAYAPWEKTADGLEIVSRRGITPPPADGAPK